MKKIGFIIYYIFIWALFILDLFVLFAAIAAILGGDFNIKSTKEWLIFIIVFISPFLLVYLLRHHLKILLKLIIKLFLFMKNIKLTLPATILLGCIILGGFFYASQISKQKSIERQQQYERKKDCYDLETSERKKFNNVDGSYYNEEKDVCVVRYINGEWREGDPNSCELFENLFDEKSTCTIERYFTKEF